MPRFITHHAIVSACVCLLTTTLLTACGGSGRTYPAAWPPLATALSAHGCSDLRGTYVFDELHRDYDATTFSVLSTFLGAGATDVYNAPLLSFTVAGDAETMLTITFTRARSALTTDLGSAPERQTVTAVRGLAYSCDHGWLVGRIKQDLRVTIPTHQSHDRADITYGKMTKGPQIVRLRRDIEGGLVGRTDVPEAREFSVQAGNGKGLPYWFDINAYWTRWVATVPTPVRTPDDVIAPEQLQRIKRQAYEQENGAGTYDAMIAAAAPPAVTAVPAPPVRPSAPVMTSAETRSAIERHIDRNATLVEARRDGERYVLTLRVTARGQVTRTIENLVADAMFADVQDHGSIASANQTELATISFKRRE